MKYLCVSLLVTIGTIAMGAVVQAEEIRGAALLQTQPASINQPASSRTQLKPFTPADLNTASQALQAKPQTPVRNSIIPAGLMTPPATAPSVSPLEFFKVPALDNGVRFKVGEN